MKAILLAVVLMFSVGCTDAEKSRIGVRLVLEVDHVAIG